jgi:CBS domain-containing protein
MSARAAWRLESLGFVQVFHYTPGKAHWLANGLPVEGQRANVPHVGALARRDVPTCHLNDRIADVRSRVQAAGWDVCVVVNTERIVLGLLRQAALTSASESVAEQVMERGPRTFRLNAEPEKAKTYMDRQGVDSVLVTTTDGELVGLLKRQDLELSQ